LIKNTGLRSRANLG